MPAYVFQGLIVHGLRVDRYARHAMPFQHIKLFRRDAVRAPRLHGKLLDLRKIKSVVYMLQQTIQFARLQRRGRPTADIDGVQYPVSIGFCDKIDFPKKRLQIQLHPLAPRCDRVGGKGAVQTRRGAERNADIQAVAVHIVYAVQDQSLPPGNIEAEPRLLITHRMCRLHLRDDLVVRKPFRQHCHRELCRSDTCEISPRERPSRVVAQVMIQGELALFFYDICVILVGVDILFRFIDRQSQFHSVIQDPYDDIAAALLPAIPLTLIVHAHIMLRIKRSEQCMYVILVILLVRININHISDLPFHGTDRHCAPLIPKDR